MRGFKTVTFTQYNVETVADNSKRYTRHTFHSVQATHCFQCMSAHPSDADLSALVGCNMLKTALSLPPTLKSLNFPMVPT